MPHVSHQLATKWMSPLRSDMRSLDLHVSAIRALPHASLQKRHVIGHVGEVDESGTSTAGTVAAWSFNALESYEDGSLGLLGFHGDRVVDDSQHPRFIGSTVGTNGTAELSASV